jgi:tRNA (guanine37-N1)-methyltransferase
MLKADVITLHPEPVAAYLGASILRRAQEKGLAELRAVNLADFCTKGDPRHADDYPFGGGAGIILKAKPIFEAVESVRQPESIVILPDAGGRRLDHRLARKLSMERHLIFICGRYKGIDERVRSLVDLEISLGDVVFTGGELAAMAVIDAAVRLIPGAITDATSALEDSFEGEGLLDCPWFTRPAEFRGMIVPEVLRSGNHAKIAHWRREQALERTQRLRPDLLEDE